MSDKTLTIENVLAGITELLTHESLARRKRVEAPAPVESLPNGEPVEVGA